MYMSTHAIITHNIAMKARFLFKYLQIDFINNFPKKPLF
jgi:hypothetical protein